MRKQILANLTILAFVTGMTTGAMAFDHKASGTRQTLPRRWNAELWSQAR